MADLEPLKLRIKNNVSLQELVGRYVKLTSGGRPKACCPFHNEKTPSFHVYDDHYYCFGCKASGDVISFVQEIEGLGFIDALRFLCERYQIPSTELDNPSAQSSTRESIELVGYKMLSETSLLFTHNLKMTADPRDYLKSRGFTDEYIKSFGFGWADEAPDSNLRHLSSRGFKTDHMIQHSIGLMARNGKAYDFFQERLMIPIRDHRGRIVAFGGRYIGDRSDVPKYKNSRETPLFHKSKLLFGLDKAKEFIRKSGKAIIVEGYMDCLMMWQHGLSDTVACLGTALTEQQLKLLKMFCKEIILLFDSDSAGQQASLKTVSNIMNIPDIHVLVAKIPEGEDPDSFLRKHGKEELESRLRQSQDLLSFAIKQKLSDSETIQYPNLVNSEFVPWIRSRTDPIQQAFLISKVAQATGIKESVISTQVNPQRQAFHGNVHGRQISKIKIEPKKARLSRIQWELLGHLYFSPNPTTSAEARAEIAKIFEEFPQFAAFVDKIISNKAQIQKSEPEESLIEDFPQMEKVIEKLNAAKNAFSGGGTENKVNNIISLWKRSHLKDQISILKAQLAKEEVGSDAERDILSEIMSLTKQLGAAQEKRSQ